MPNVNINFNGATLVIPAAYYQDNVSAVLQPTQSLTPPLIFIGNFYGLAPKTPTTYTLAQNASAAMRGAPAAQYLNFMANPSPTLNGAQYITLINASENTQATAYINSSASAPLIQLTSANYGAACNLLQYEVQAGTLAGYMVTLIDGYANTSITGDNLGVPLQISYVGSAATVTAVVSGTAAGASVLNITSSNAGESVSVNLTGSGYSTIAQVAAYLNGTGYYLANAISNSALPSTNLNLVSGVALPKPVNNVNTYVNFNATIGDVLYWVNNYASAYATGTITSGAVLTTAYTLASVLPTHFSGGANIPPTNSDYATSFNVALGTPGWAVFADSNAPAVMALGAQHAQTASSALYGKWRRFITGSSVGDSVATTVQNATQLNSITASYCYPGIYATNPITGANTLYGGLAVAAAVAGIMCGNVIAQPLTNQQLSGNGIEQAGGTGQYLSVSQINQLQQAGVMVLYYPTTNVPTIVSDLTCWQGDNNPENLFNQQVACRWGLAYSLAAAVQPYIGSIASPYGLTRIQNAVVNILNQLIYSPGNNGVLVSWNPQSLNLVYTGTTQSLTITVNVVLVGQIRFILEQTFVQPLNLAL